MFENLLITNLSSYENIMNLFEHDIETESVELIKQPLEIFFSFQWETLT